MTDSTRDAALGHLHATRKHLQQTRRLSDGDEEADEISAAQIAEELGIEVTGPAPPAATIDAGCAAEVPWRDYDASFAGWRARATCGEHTSLLSRDEVLNACAAFELGREPQSKLRSLIAARASGERGSLSWADMVDGAAGLRVRTDAPGIMSLATCLEGLGISDLEIQYPPSEAARDE